MLCEELNDMFAVFTEIPSKCEIEHHIEFSNTIKAPPKPTLSRINQIK